MGYFSDGYSEFRYKIKEGDNPGLRRAQIGAIHAVAAHFSLRSDPAIVTMPTGSGKTAVLIACAFILRAQRVLIITPSRLVREQVTDEVAQLTTLKKAESIGADYPGPRVVSTHEKVKTQEDWEAMRESDVVVATIQSISPGYEDIPEPPNDLFDLILIDEAHHSPARTWQALLDHFQAAKKILFTATPFREDQKEMKGRFVYTYSLQDAFNDEIFGQITFSPVTPVEDQNHDAAIATATERQFRADTELGFQHRVMVRTDGLTRANELLRIYQENTALRLSVITGNHSLRYVKRVIGQLGEGTLDGIICVNMLGEGFNFPNLKIAAVHAPYKSLSVTLQFVGRFARTVGHGLGPATFLAIPSDVEIEAKKLYDSRAVWQEMIINLAALRVNQEALAREILQSFTPIATIPDLSDFSLHSLEPYYHVKVYQLYADINIEQDIALPKRFQIAYQSVSIQHNSVIFITREIRTPKWVEDERLASVESDLFIFYFHPDTRLLFICSTRRTDGLYEEIVETLDQAIPKPLPLVKLNKALNDLTATEFFNIGMRNRVSSNTNESYRIISGGSADKSVLKSDSRLYHRGHAFGRAMDNGNQVTIGLSSASKIWSNKSSKLPELVQWCTQLAQKINSDRNPVTNSGLDYLSPGEELERLPANIIAADWPSKVYTSQPVISFTDEQAQQVRVPLLDFDLKIDNGRSTEEAIVIVMKTNVIEFSFTFSFDTNRFFEPLGEQPELAVLNERTTIPFMHYLNAMMLNFYTDDLSSIEGYSIFRAPQEGLEPFNVEAIETKDWSERNTNIEREFGNAGEGLISIHDFIRMELENSDSPVVYYDHGTGEIADYISFKETNGRLLIRFYHAKGSPAANPGHRLDSITELQGQIVKSVTWGAKRRILDSIKRRFRERKGAHTFIRGDLDTLEQILSQNAESRIDYEFIAVQPGLLKMGLPEELAHMLASANDYLIRGGFKPLKVLSS